MGFHEISFETLAKCNEAAYATWMPQLGNSDWNKSLRPRQNGTRFANDILKAFSLIEIVI